MPRVLRISLSFFFPLILCGPASIAMAQNAKPTNENVRKAVQNYFGADAERRQAAQDLARWGPAALPELRALAMEPGNSRIGWSIVVAVNLIGNKDAARLILDIAEKKTQIDHDQAVGAFVTMMDDPTQLGYLINFPDFKDLILELGAGKNSHTQQVVTKLIAKMKWKEGVPVLKHALESEDLSVRETAAEALTGLTGEKVDIKRPALKFPSQKLNSISVKRLGELPKGGWMTSSISIGRWFDGKPGIVQWNSGVLSLQSGDLKRIASLQLASMAHSFFLTGGSEDKAQLVALVSDRRQPEAEYAIAINAQGKAVWQDHPQTARAKALAPLYGEDGSISGAVIGYGGHDGIVVTDLSGKRVTQISDYHVMYQLSTHPRLANTFLACGGSLDLFRLKGSQATRVRDDDSRQYYFGNAFLFSDETGRAAILASGKGLRNGEPAIVHLDDHFQEDWKASLPVEVRNLAILDGFGDFGTPIFIAVSDKGQMLIFDGKGELLHQGQIDAEEGSQGPIYGVAVGRIENGRAIFTVGIVRSVLVYEIKLASPEKK